MSELCVSLISIRYCGRKVYACVYVRNICIGDKQEWSLYEARQMTSAYTPVINWVEWKTMTKIMYQIWHYAK